MKSENSLFVKLFLLYAKVMISTLFRYWWTLFPGNILLETSHSDEISNNFPRRHTFFPAPGIYLTFFCTRHGIFLSKALVLYIGRSFTGNLWGDSSCSLKYYKCQVDWVIMIKFKYVHDPSKYHKLPILFHIFKKVGI